MKSLLAIILALLFFSVGAETTDFKSILKKAITGDYQAQRNIAYGFADYPYKGQDKNPTFACAWYIVILESGSTKIHQGDIGNVQVCCGKLNQQELYVAKNQARNLYETIYKKTAKF